MGGFVVAARKIRMHFSPSGEKRAEDIIMLIVVAHTQTPDRASASPQASTSPQTSTSTRRSTQTETPFPAEARGSWQAADSGPSTQAPCLCAEQKAEQGRPGQAGPGQQWRGAQLNSLDASAHWRIMYMTSKAWKIALHFFLYPSVTGVTGADLEDHYWEGRDGRTSRGKRTYTGDR